MSTNPIDIADLIWPDLANNRQPQGGIKLSNKWLSKGLCHAIIGGYDHATGKTLTFNDCYKTTNSIGVGTTVLATSSLGLTTESKVVTSSGDGYGDFTIGFFGKYSTAVKAFDIAITNNYEFDNPNRRHVYFAVNALGNLTYTSGYASASLQTVAETIVQIASVVDDTPRLYIMRRANGVIQIMSGDVFSSTVSGVDSSKSIYYSTATIFSVSGGGGFGGWGNTNGVTNLTLAFNSALTDDEIRSLGKNPWQIFKNQSQIIYPQFASIQTYNLILEQSSYTLLLATSNLLLNRYLENLQVVYTETLTDATLAYNRYLQTDQANYTLTGTDTSLFFHRVLPVDAGSYTLTGTDLNLTLHRKLVTDQISYTFGLADVTLSKTTVGNYTFVVDQGIYIITGTDAALLTQRLASFESGSYTLTLSASNLLFNRTIQVEQGAYSLTQADANLLASRILSVGAGSFTYLGQDVVLTYTPAGAYLLTVDQMVYTFDMLAANLLFNRVLQAEAGDYTLSGIPINLLRGLALPIDTGSLTSSFANITLSFSHVNNYSLTIDSQSYAISNADATMLVNRIFALDAVNYTISSSIINLIKPGQSVVKAEANWQIVIQVTPNSFTIQS